MSSTSPKKEIKYIVFPGFISSCVDLSTHFVTGKMLIQAYGVDPKECYIVEYTELVPDEYCRLPALTPRYYGDYQYALYYTDWYTCDPVNPGWYDTNKGFVEWDTAWKALGVTKWRGLTKKMR